MAIFRKMEPVQTNESKVRLIAGLVLLLATGYFLLPQIIIPVFLVLDFALRAFGFSAYSPLGWLAGWIVKMLRLPVKPVYYPPKKFAAKIGFLLSLVIVILHLSGFSTLILISILCFFAALESVFSICAGCYVYSFLQNLKK